MAGYQEYMPRNPGLLRACLSSRWQSVELIVMSSKLRQEDAWRGRRDDILISWRAPLGPPGDESRAPNLAMEAVSPSYPLGALGVQKGPLYSTVACTRHFAGSPSEPHRSAPRAKIAHYGLTPSCPGSLRNSPGRLRDKRSMDGDRETLLLGSRDPAGPLRKRKRSGIPGGARSGCVARRRPGLTEKRL